MKKELGIFGFLFSMLTLVSAQEGVASGLGKGMNQVIGMIEGMLGPFFSAILGGESGMLFEKILFLVIIFVIVYLVIGQTTLFTDKTAIIWIISISISLLSTRFMSGDLLKTMLLPYTTLGVTLTAIIPLIIYFMFVFKVGEESSTLRKMLWIFYIVTFLTVWSTRYNDIGEISYIYIGSAMVALIFLLADGTIRRTIENQREKELKTDNRKERISGIKFEMDEILKNKHLDESARARIMKRYKKRIETISKM